MSCRSLCLRSARCVRPSPPGTRRERGSILRSRCACLRSNWVCKQVRWPFRVRVHNGAAVFRRQGEFLSTGVCCSLMRLLPGMLWRTKWRTCRNVGIRQLSGELWRSSARIMPSGGGGCGHAATPCSYKNTPASPSANRRRREQGYFIQELVDEFGSRR